MTTKLNRQKAVARSYKREYNNLRVFLLEVMKVAAMRDRDYLLRKHGDIANKECADNLVALCKMFDADQYEATVERMYKKSVRARSHDIPQ